MPKIICLMFLVISFSLFAQSPVPKDTELEKVAGGFKFVEGPVWNDSLGLLFSDMNSNKIDNYTPAGKIKVFLSPSDSSNGLTYDLQGRLLMTQTGLRRVARMESDGKQTVLASSYEGKKLNSPNDIVCKSDGSIFFTDPTFNIPKGQHQELSFSGIYRISSKSGKLQCLDSTLALPNGICFSPDEKKLYVNDSQVRIIWVWDLSNDSVLTNKRVFARIKPSGYADGMKVDPEGDLFCAGPLGIWVFSPAGTLLDTILVPETPSNCNWGDSDRKTLYITAQTSLYKIRLASGADKNGMGYLPSNFFKLCANYPNPFNPSTTITFNVSKAQNVQLNIFDAARKEISTILNDYVTKVVHKIHFNGT